LTRDGSRNRWEFHLILYKRIWNSWWNDNLKKSIAAILQSATPFWYCVYLCSRQLITITTTCLKICFAVKMTQFRK
jgi:hypothetical protein